MSTIPIVSTRLSDLSGLWTLSACELQERFASGEVSPVDALRACLGRLAEVGNELNALVHVDEAGAEAAARASEARWRTGEPLGKLDGVPVTVKDSIHVAGMPATWGSRLYADAVPERDETPVARLREGGAVIFGKTNVPEFTVQGYTSNPLFGPTRNPWDTRLTPGGSSGGAVAAVAAGIGPLAIGTDAGGSIRRPASHAGLVGLKPTAGRVPRREGFPPIMLDLEVIGPIARTTTDLASAMAVISAADPREAPRRPEAPFRAESTHEGGGRARILYVPTFVGAPVDAEIASSVTEAAHCLAALGYAIEESRSFDLADRINEAWPLFGQVGIAWLLGRHPGRADEVGPDIRALADLGAAVPATHLLDVQHMAFALRENLAALFATCDLILTPTAAALPWPAELTHPATIAGVPVGPRGSAIFTGFVNASGCPAISIPCRPSAAGLPIGFQLVAPWGGDERLVATAAVYEAAHPWPMLWHREAVR